ncbi:MAG: hypothetical protein Alpg2KO_14430 [Alphaproteobacteria bacterium]
MSEFKIIRLEDGSIGFAGDPEQMRLVLAFALRQCCQMSDNPTVPEPEREIAEALRPRIKSLASQMRIEAEERASAARLAAQLCGDIGHA